MVEQGGRHARALDVFRAAEGCIVNPDPDPHLAMEGAYVMVRWLFLAAMVLFIAPEAAAPAPTQHSASSSGLSQAESDALVDAISKSVVKQLKEEGVGRSDASSAHAANPSAPIEADRD